MTDVFQKALKHYSKGYVTKEKIIWWGNWKIESNAKVYGGTLHISRVSSDSFFFQIVIYDGARSGRLLGKAQILTPHSAFARIRMYDDLYCEIIFRRRLENGVWFVEVEEGENCDMFRGLGASFSGNYRHSPEMVINYEFLDEIDLNEIERITGKYLSVFLENFQQIGFGENLDNEDFTVITAGVKGLYTIMESIVVLDNLGSVWCAFIDPEIDVIRYFSSKSNKDEDKPNSIKSWLSKFLDKKIIENDENEQYLGEEF